MDVNCVECNEAIGICMVCSSGYYPANKNQCLLIPSFCGDGLVSVSEKCDDGNTENGDGCSSSCNIEKKYNCLLNKPQGPSICYLLAPPTFECVKSNLSYNQVILKTSRPL